MTDQEAKAAVLALSGTVAEQMRFAAQQLRQATPDGRQFGDGTADELDAAAAALERGPRPKTPRPDCNACGGSGKVTDPAYTIAGRDCDCWR